ncbi:redoxin family protein [bacterium]|nr:redoxin family protein [bacterium]
MRWIAFTPLALLLALVLAAGVRLVTKDPDEQLFTSPERPAPAISAPTLTGGEVNFADLGPGPVLVNFWATWCAPCEVEHPMLIRLAEQGVRIVGVLHRDDPAKGAQALAQAGNPFSEVALDPQGEVYLAFGLAGVPETFLVNREGRIVKTLRGPLTAADVADFLSAYRAEAAAG